MDENNSKRKTKLVLRCSVCVVCALKLLSEIRSNFLLTFCGTYLYDKEHEWREYIPSYPYWGCEDLANELNCNHVFAIIIITTQHAYNMHFFFYLDTQLQFRKHIWILLIFWKHLNLEMQSISTFVIMFTCLWFCYTGVLTLYLLCVSDIMYCIIKKWK